MSVSSNDSISRGGNDEEYELSSAHSTSRDSAGGSGNDDKDEKLKESLVKKETRQVFYLRVLVIMVLVASAAAIAVVVFYVSKNAEKDDLQTNYDGAADMVLEAFINILKEKMSAAGSLVVSIVDTGLKHSEGWPFVTLSSFARRAETIKDLSQSLYIGLNPVVKHEDQEKWEYYSTHGKDAQWYNESVAYQETLGIMDLDNRPQVETDDPNLKLYGGVANRIYSLDRDAGALAYISPEQPFYLPIWQTSPVTRRSMVNQNRASNSEGARRCLEDDAIVFEGMQHSRPGYGDDSDPYTAEFAWLLRLANGERTKYLGDILSTVYLPLYDSFVVEERDTVGVMRLVIHWARFFTSLLPQNIKGLILVLDNHCDKPYTYRIDGPEVIPVGHGDLHDPRFDGSLRTAHFGNITHIADGTARGMRLAQHTCVYSIRVYQSEMFRNEYYSNRPALITCAVGFVFVFTIFMFFVYDRLVERRQKLIMMKAQQTSDIVASLFPQNVRDRLLDGGKDGDENKKQQGGAFLTKNMQLGPCMDDGQGESAIIADLFPNTTVCFADIAGFTAWSSSRGPEQVFFLLETIYQSFDVIAKRRKVFKVETIGDSYVSVTGLPNPQDQHAVIMARFAAECLLRLQEVLEDLAITLGPDTGDLDMRFGLHSGPVTAGVLRGDRSRFQLFGDTVNTAARMESTGVKGRIQASQSTADLLTAVGKGHWVRPREDAVLAKGKGVLNTFWVNPRASKGSNSINSSSANSEHNSGPSKMEATIEADNVAKMNRHVNWITTVFVHYIAQVRAAHKAMSTAHCPLQQIKTGESSLDEIVEVIHLPKFDDRHASSLTKAQPEEVDEEISILMQDFVRLIASTYHDHPFHNFEHACHVTMSVDKFMRKIVAPDVDKEKIQEWKEHPTNAKEIASHLYDYTHGINSDPITLFAIVFSALIHDADHRGVSNKQLMVEEENMANYFRNKSIAEQNSLDIAWKIWMSDQFTKLREYIFATQEELARFRQVIVNVVLATDIFDKELNDLRRNRWEKAFSDGASLAADSVNGLRATIVVEHIMQASDVAHTMQHWHVYQKWNKRLFKEMLQAYQADRLAANPTDFWYKGELGFFDNYIIPLAKKLKDCQVFGVSSDEMLNYAMRNRAEWEVKGKDLVEQFVEEFDHESPKGEE